MEIEEIANLIKPGEIKDFNHFFGSIKEIPSLRKKEDKFKFYSLIFYLIKKENKQLLTDFFSKRVDISNHIKSYKMIGELLLETGKLDKSKLEESKLIANKYNGWYINISEEEYIRNGYSLAITNFQDNFESLSRGVYDYIEGKYIVGKEEMSKILSELGIVKEMKWKKRTTSSNRMSIDSKIVINNLNNLSLKKLHLRLSKNPELFYSEYNNLFEEMKYLNKINDILIKPIKLLILDFLADKAKETSGIKNAKESILKTMKTQMDYFSYITNIAKKGFKIKGSNKPSEGQNYNFKFDINCFGSDFSGNYLETLERELVFKDMRKTEVRNKIADSMRKIKDYLLKIGYFKNGKIRNVFIERLQKKLDFDLNDFLEKREDYKKILTYRNVQKLK